MELSNCRHVLDVMAKKAKIFEKISLPFIDVLEIHYNESHATATHEEEHQFPANMDDFLESYIEVTDNVKSINESKMTGVDIKNVIIQALQYLTLCLTAVVAQEYDGASVMSSENVGTSATVKESCSFAEYYHCSVHSLNLCLVHSSKSTAIRNIIGLVQEITSFSLGATKEE